MKIAIVHERLDVLGGAERVIQSLHALYPDAPIYTSFVDLDNLPSDFSRMDIRTSYMQKLPTAIKKQSDKLLPLYMLAFQDFDLSAYDVVLSSSYVAAKSILTPSSTCHICYCHTPMRFAWDLYPQFMQGGSNRIVKMGIRLLLQYFRLWDVQTSNNVDQFVANSQVVRQRIRKHYRREAEVIPPPVETYRFTPAPQPRNYYVAVSRLVPYKRVDLAVEAFNKLGLELIVIGSGREEKKLRAMAGPTVRILGWQPDEEVARYLSEAKGLIFPGEEDFGILPVEAQAAGCPVIAYGKGGALETILANRTGVFFAEQTADSIVEAVGRFEKLSLNRDDIAAHAREFDEAVFRQRIDDFLQRSYREFMSDKTSFLGGETSVNAIIGTRQGQKTGVS
ncbi:MAG: glycosyltransferase [Chthonomonadaceae bacterium]|nr:glycosyltransferase [Chthonomonadaceae bacterium]